MPAVSEKRTKQAYEAPSVRKATLSGKEAIEGADCVGMRFT